MRKNKKSFKIIGATGMTLFTLVASFTAAIAWFTAENNPVTASFLTVSAKNKTTSFVSVEVHKCIPDQCTSTTYAFNSEIAFTIQDGGSPTSSLIIDDYGELNKSQPVLLLFNLKADSTQGDVKITAHTNTTTFLQAITDSNKNSYPLSNAVSFKSAAFNKPGNTFQYGTITISDLTTTSKFVDSLTQGASLTQNPVIYDGSTGSTPTAAATHIAVVMDYYYDAVNAVKNYASTSSVVAANNNRLGFSCDWTMVIS